MAMGGDESLPRRSKALTGTTFWGFFCCPGTSTIRQNLRPPQGLVPGQGPAKNGMTRGRRQMIASNLGGWGAGP